MKAISSMSTKAALLSSALLMALAFPLYSSDGPSIKETQIFINDRSNIKITTTTQDQFYSVIFDDNCQIIVITQLVETYKDDGKTDYIFDSVNLKMLDPNEVVVRDEYTDVLIKSTDGKEVVKMSYQRNGKAESYSKYLRIYSTKDNVERVAKAMRHLITKCGGKSPLF